MRASTRIALFAGLFQIASLSSCKKKSSGRDQVVDKIITEISVPATSEVIKPAVDAARTLRATEIHDAILAVLDAKFPKEKGLLWSSANMQLDDDFFVASPEGIWGVDASQLAATLDCDKKDAACDPDFLRLSCASDADCKVTSTHCVAMDASVKALNEIPKKMCISPADHMLNRFYKVMVSAEKELDITSLSMADGRFRIAMNNAFAVLSQKPTPPTIRMLFSGFNSVLPNAVNPPQKIMTQIMDDVKKLSASADSLRMNIAWLADGVASWNHSKIVVADGNHALAGGHNMWDVDYLRPNPISDLSLEYKGEAAEKARDFINGLWLLITTDIGTSGTKVGRLPPHEMHAESKDGVAAINVGRLGTYGASPSDQAIIGLIDSAKESLKMDQQDYFNLVASNAVATRSFAFDAIVSAALRGVKVTMIQSNKFPIGGYGMVDPQKAYAVYIDELAKRLVKEKKVAIGDAKKTACDSIVFAPFRLTAKLTEWPNNGGPFGTHTKWIMADDVATYVGSQNLYPANLQEYGSIITDATAVAKLKEGYWDKLWKESSSAILPCP